MKSLNVRKEQFTRFGSLLLVVVVTAALAATAQTLRQGIHVQLATTHNAVAFPAADADDAKVVAIAQNGTVYLGASETTPDALVETLKSHPFRRTANLYIKADARTPYANVSKVLDPLRAVGFDKMIGIVLLTGQTPAPTGTPAPPSGLQVLLKQPVTASKPIILKTLPQQPSSVNINGTPVPLDQLQATLRRLIQESSNNVTILNASDQSSFAQVVDVIDRCSSAGAKLVLAAPAI